MEAHVVDDWAQELQEYKETAPQLQDPTLPMTEDITQDLAGLESELMRMKKRRRPRPGASLWSCYAWPSPYHRANEARKGTGVGFNPLVRGASPTWGGAWRGFWAKSGGRARPLSLHTGAPLRS